MRWLAAVALVTLAATPALAARAELSVSPDPPVPGQPNVVSGCGYFPSSEVEVYFLWDEGFTRKWDHLIVRWTASDETGCFSMSWTPEVAGLYKIRVDQVAHGRDHLQAQLVFEVS